MLDLKYICKSFNDVRVPNRVNLHLDGGLVYTLKGGNSSGKSRLIKILALKTKIFDYPIKNQGKLSEKVRIFESWLQCRENAVERHPNQKC